MEQFNGRSVGGILKSRELKLRKVGKKFMRPLPQIDKSK